MLKNCNHVLKTSRLKKAVNQYAKICFDSSQRSRLFLKSKVTRPNDQELGKYDRCLCTDGSSENPANEPQREYIDYTLLPKQFKKKVKEEKIEEEALEISRELGNEEKPTTESKYLPWKGSKKRQGLYR